MHTGHREGREGRRGGGWRWEGGSEEKDSKDNENDNDNGTVFLINKKNNFSTWLATYIP